MSLIPELGKQKQMVLFEFYPVPHGEFQTSHGCVPQKRRGGARGGGGKKNQYS